MFHVQYLHIISMPNRVDEVVETVDTFISSRDVVPCLGVTVVVAAIR